MKLRTKKTGEVVDYNPTLERWNGPIKEIKHYVSLAELNEEWEDYEEAKEYWFIDFNGEVKEFELLGFEWQGWMKEIGNYFETKEEAEKAVEKLKAWKRLKDNGFRFKYIENNHIEFNSGYIDNADQFINDMGLIFGGEK